MPIAYKLIETIECINEYRRVPLTVFLELKFFIEYISAAALFQIIFLVKHTIIAILKKNIVLFY